MSLPDSHPILLPFPPPGHRVPPVVATWLEQMAANIGNTCSHEWVMHLPPRREMPTNRDDITFAMVLPLRITCIHCPAWFELRNEGGQVVAKGERLNA